MNIKNIFKHLKWSHLLCVIVLFGFNIIFFQPQFQGKKIKTHDGISATAWNKQIVDYQSEAKERAYWNPSMFSGMPWGFLGIGVKENICSFLNDVSHFYIAYPTGYGLKASFLTFLALLLLGVSPWASVFLSLVYMLSTYHFGLYTAGHSNKIEVIYGFPLLISGMIIAFRGKYLSGFTIVAVSFSIAFLRNHPQMVYYLMLVLFVFALVYIIYTIIEDKSALILKAATIVVLAAILGVGSNISQLLSASDFAEDTMRGKAILKEEGIDAKNSSASSSSVNGLAWDYAMSYSSGASDFWTLLIPRALGGSSQEEIGKRGDTPLADLMARNGSKAEKDGNYIFSGYFGNIELGYPFYSGIFLVLIFVFSLFTNKRKYSVSFIIAFIFLFMLAMGKNSPINAFLFDYLPYFNKWRAPSSIMSVFPALFVIAGGIGIASFMEKNDKSKYFKPILITGGSLIAITLFYYIYATSNFAFLTEREGSMQAQVKSIIIETRKILLTDDVLRTILFLIIGTSLLAIYSKGKIKEKIFLLLFGVIAILDITQVARRYFDDDSWSTPTNFYSEFNPRPVDNQIFSLEKKGRGYYRVLDQSINPYNSSLTSYHHNTVGGYHAAKLQRYQDIITNHLGKGNMQVLNMLNTKYFITQKQQLQINDQVNGEAWFINDLKTVTTPKEEIESLNNINTKTQAVILAKEFNQEAFDNIGNGNGSIELTYYSPNEMGYTSTNNTDQFAVFSEVWFNKKGEWSAYVDGVEKDIVRVNYILRGLEIPANAKNIEFKLKPIPSFPWVSNICSGLILLLIISILLRQLIFKGKTLDFISKYV